jgi:hypothetical protein
VNMGLSFSHREKRVKGKMGKRKAKSHVKFLSLDLFPISPFRRFPLRALRLITW